MNITLEKANATNASIKVVLEESDYQPKVVEKLKEYGKKASIKGFRPGKVPPALIQKMYGKGVLVDEINNLLTKSVNEYIKESKLNLVGEPLPDVEKGNAIDWDTQKTFEFSYSIGIAPDFTIDLSANQTVASYAINLTDKEIEETLTNLRRQYGQTSNPETSEEGDIVHGTLKQVNGDFNAQVIIPLNQVNKAALSSFVGLSKEGSVIFDIQNTFENEDVLAQVTKLPKEEAAKLDGEFELTISNITRNAPAELNQEFFDKVLGLGTVEGEDAFRTKVKEIIGENYKREADARLNKDIQETLINQHSFELPDEFLKRWLLVTNEGEVTVEQIESEYDLYARELRWSLIKNKIAESNDIKVEHEEVMSRTKDLIRQQFGMGGVNEALESSLDTFADNFLKAEKGKNYMNIYNQVFSDKIFDLVKNKVTIEQKPIEVEEFRKLAFADTVSVEE